jgi:hypothetical protein
MRDSSRRRSNCLSNASRRSQDAREGLNVGWLHQVMVRTQFSGPRAMFRLVERCQSADDPVTVPTLSPNLPDRFKSMNDWKARPIWASRRLMRSRARLSNRPPS